MVKFIEGYCVCVSEWVSVSMLNKNAYPSAFRPQRHYCMPAFIPLHLAISLQTRLLWIVVSIPPLLAHQISSVFCPHPLQSGHLKYSHGLRLAHFSFRFIHSLLCLPLPWVAVNTHLLHSWGWASRNNFHYVFLLGERGVRGRGVCI